MSNACRKAIPKGVFPSLLVAFLATAGAVAQEAEPPSVPAAPPAAEGSASTELDSADTEDEVLRFSDTVQVTTSRRDSSVLRAPVTVAVLPTQQIEAAAATNYADLMRGVPGLNVIQTSARDVSMTTRGATRLLAKGELALLDGRSVYQDYQGFVLWDYLPVEFDEIQQVEVLSGPGSAVWGPNALSGVVNIRTKTPAELDGGFVKLGVGNRDLRHLAGRWADGGEKVGYKLSGSYFEQAAWGRDPNLPDGTPLPPGFDFPNEGTEQVKVDGRVDVRSDGGGRWSLRSGYASSTGITITSLGPFSTQPGSYVAYGQARYEKGGLDAGVYWNGIGGESTNLLSGIEQTFSAHTFAGEVTGRRTLGSKQALVYGASVRLNRFDLSLAPEGDSRNDAGIFIEDRIFLHPKLEMSVGARLDYFDTIGTVVSPRASLLVKPTSNQSIRTSYSRAYRPPSMVENYLFSISPTAIELVPGLPPYVYPIVSTGNEELVEETIDAFEIGYTVAVDQRTTLMASVYRNVTQDLIEFFPVEFYGPGDPPPDWPLPPQLVPPLTLPKNFTFLNVGEVRAQGIQLSAHVDWSPTVRTVVTYTYQDRSEDTSDGPLPVSLNQPPRHMGSASIDGRHGRFRGSASVSYTDQAFWSDVLDQRFWGYTDPYWLVNARVAVAFHQDKLEIAFSGNNLFDEPAQQHVFGDIIGRLVKAELRVRF